MSKICPRIVQEPTFVAFGEEVFGFNSSGKRYQGRFLCLRENGSYIIGVDDGSPGGKWVETLIALPLDPKRACVGIFKGLFLKEYREFMGALSHKVKVVNSLL